MNFGSKLLNSFFCSVTPRTAGFNSVEIREMNPVSQMLTTILMFIGGSSGSTAGGVKQQQLLFCFFVLLQTYATGTKL